MFSRCSEARDWMTHRSEWSSETTTDDTTAGYRRMRGTSIHATRTKFSVGTPRSVLICDRDRKWSGPVLAFLRSAGVHVVQTPVRAPNCNAHAERFVRSIKFECLNRLIPLGERHLRRAIHEYVAHYHYERNHQGLDNELIVGVTSPRRTGTVRCAQRLGGLLNSDHRAA